MNYRQKKYYKTFLLSLLMLVFTFFVIQKTAAPAFFISGDFFAQNNQGGSGPLVGQYGNFLANKYEMLEPGLLKDFFTDDDIQAGGIFKMASGIKKIRSLKNLALNIFFKKEEKGMPTLYLIGDSTVKNGKGDGAGGLWGWGNFLSSYFDTTKINVENKALGGTSSRTYRTRGLWEDILIDLKKGDFVIMQFGHNDNIALTDTIRSRGTIKGISNDSVEVYNPLIRQQEWVHSYGWYMKQFIIETKEKGAIPIIASSVPQNKWENGNLISSFEDYSIWAEEVAKENNTYFIPLNRLISEGYIELGEEKVRNAFFNTNDRTHTTEEGAKFSAMAVVEGIRLIGSPLKMFLKVYQEKDNNKR